MADRIKHSHAVSLLRITMLGQFRNSDQCPRAVSILASSHMNSQSGKQVLVKARVINNMLFQQLLNCMFLRQPSPSQMGQNYLVST